MFFIKKGSLKVSLNKSGLISFKRLNKNQLEFYLLLPQKMWIKQILNPIINIFFDLTILGTLAVEQIFVLSWLLINPNNNGCGITHYLQSLHSFLNYSCCVCDLFIALFNWFNDVVIDNGRGLLLLLLALILHYFIQMEVY